MSAIEQKIAKLLRLAESSNPHEAELAQAQAERLMVKWGLDEAVIRSLDADKSKQKIAVVEKSVLFTGIYDHGLQLMASSVGRAYGTVRCLIGDAWVEDAKGNKYGLRAKKVYIIGHEDEVDRCITLIKSLEIQCIAAMTQWWKDREKERRAAAKNPNDFDPFRLPKLTPMEAFKARRQFILSFGNACWSRIHKMRESVLAEVKQERGAKSTEVALLDREKEVDEFMQRVYPSLKNVRSNLRGSNEGRAEGHRAGMSADVGGTQISR
jgi:uncharacterized protein DUF2786